MQLDLGLSLGGNKLSGWDDQIHLDELSIEQIDEMAISEIDEVLI